MPVARSRESLAVGIVAAVLVAASGAPEVAVLVGWIFAAAGLLVQVWRVSWPADHDETKGWPRRKDRPTPRTPPS